MLLLFALLSFGFDDDDQTRTHVAIVGLLTQLFHTQQQQEAKQSKQQ
jgi:hypothetical protein